MLGANSFGQDATNFLPFTLILIAFVATFIGNTMVIGAYNLFYSERYYDFNKIFASVLLANSVLFFFFILLYLTWNIKDNSLLMILAFHVIFSIFVSYNIIEMFPIPQYSISGFLWNTIGFTIVIVVYMMIYNSTKLSSESSQIYNLMLWPSILAYTVIPLVQWLWQNIYRWFYEKWSDPLYTPTEQERLEEVVQSEEDLIQNEEVSVESEDVV